jgi:hypothetical protein
MRGQSSLLNKSPNIRLQSFLQIIQKALDMNWESIYKDDAGDVSNTEENLFLISPFFMAAKGRFQHFQFKFTRADMRKASMLGNSELPIYLYSQTTLAHRQLQHQDTVPCFLACCGLIISELHEDSLFSCK